MDDFNQQAKTPLDEWIAFLKTGEIDKRSTARGLCEASERLRIDQLPNVRDSRSRRLRRYLENMNMGRWM